MALYNGTEQKPKLFSWIEWDSTFIVNFIEYGNTFI